MVELGTCPRFVEELQDLLLPASSFNQFAITSFLSYKTDKSARAFGKIVAIGSLGQPKPQKRDADHRLFGVGVENATPDVPNHLNATSPLFNSRSTQ